MNRPYFNHSIDALETLYAENSKNLQILKELNAELECRTTQRASKLAQAVKTAIENLTPKPIPKSPPTPTPSPTPSPNPVTSKNDILQHMTDEERVLSNWIALEVLSPQSFKKPQELASNGEPRLVCSFAKKLPWEGEAEKSIPNYKMFFQVIVGTINMEQSISQLLSVYADARVEKPATKGEAILAVIVVDKEGVPVENPAISISSYAWAYSQAMKGDLTTLNNWPEAERNMNREMEDLIRLQDADENPTALNYSTLDNIYNHLVRKLELPASIVAKKQFAIKVFEYYKNSEPPQPLLLNSFFLNDLIYARQLISKGKGTPNLNAYLKSKHSHQRFDLLTEHNKLENIVAPNLINPARWPSGKGGLVLMQQAAVNLALSELKDLGIIGVNGPPGTGKTTLLRDNIAGIICEKARKMAEYDDPQDAFSHSGQKTQAGNAWLHMYYLDDSLKGYEILIASSNNKAVENVSTELPGINAIRTSFETPGYFKALSDKLLNQETWGLISAVLGNMMNRSKFKQTFWWDEEVAMSKYLAEICGIPQEIDVIDEQTKKVIGKRKPKLIAAEKPPTSHEEALIQWIHARQSFNKALADSEKQLKCLEEIRSAIYQIETLKSEEIDIQKQLHAVSEKLNTTTAHRTQLDTEIQNNQKQVYELEAEKMQLKESKPWFLAMLLNTKDAKIWREKNNDLKNRIFSLTTDQNALLQKRSSLQKSESHFANQVKKLDTVLAPLQTKIKEVNEKIKTARKAVGQHIVDKLFFSKSRESRHLTIPWCDAQTQNLREQVFLRAIQLHKAFINAAAKPIRHNLGNLMNAFSGRGMKDADKQALLGDLWSTLFLVVPSFSTTFASMERMFGNMPEEFIGWLLIDEAGQALPQAAVGGIFRSKRTIVVGDPRQIEPIVTLPGTLTTAIGKTFGIDTDIFNAPEASVQTIADCISPYCGEIPTNNGNYTVGVPLLVHRRCEDPMFSISNNIAYGKQMVPSKSKANSPIRNCLGPSVWIDIQSSATQDKWSELEGKAVLELLDELKKAAVHPDVYIISPFVIVAENLRRIIIESRLLHGWVDKPDSWVYERVGTVHTVQGREAEAVFFVLGAPASNQLFARTWAGGKPNLLNVAVTRAKEVLYVVGDKTLWEKSGCFKELANRI